MAARLQISIANEREIDLLLAKIQGRVKNAKPVFEFIADSILAPALQGQMRTEGKRGGTPWPKYTVAEVKSGYVGMKKAITGSKGPLLDWKGPGRRLVPSFQKGHPDNVRRVTRNSAEFGTKVPYAVDHDRGGGPGWKGKYKLPRRRIAVLTTRHDLSAMNEAVEQFILTGKIKRGPVSRVGGDDGRHG